MTAALTFSGSAAPSSPTRAVASAPSSSGQSHRPCATGRARQAVERLVFGAGYRDHGRVFPRPGGEPLNTYSHVTPGVQRDAVTRVASRFLDPAGSSLLANEPASATGATEAGS